MGDSHRTVLVQTLGDNVRVRCPGGTGQDALPVTSPHRIETWTGLGVAITREVLDGDARATEVGGHVTSALGGPVPVGAWS